MFRENGKPWWNFSPELRARGYQWIKKLTLEKAPTDSATGSAFQDNANPCGQVRQNGTVASAWFSRPLTANKFDEMFLESAVRLGGRGVLTFLEPHTL
jgi:hypothetical protein